jgi:hypothetical protein
MFYDEFLRSLLFIINQWQYLFSLEVVYQIDNAKHISCLTGHNVKEKSEGRIASV